MDKSSMDNIDKWRSLVIDSCDPIPPIYLTINKIDACETEEEEIYDEIYETYSHLFSGIVLCSALSGDGMSYAFLTACRAGIQFIKSCGSSAKSKAMQSSCELSSKTEHNNCCI